LTTTLTQERQLRAQMILEGAWVDCTWALGVSHTGYSSCDAKEHMFKEGDIFTFHLNNLCISSSVSLAGETNRSLEKKMSLSKLRCLNQREYFRRHFRQWRFVPFSVSEIFML